MKSLRKVYELSQVDVVAMGYARLVLALVSPLPHFRWRVARPNEIR